MGNKAEKMASHYYDNENKGRYGKIIYKAIPEIGKIFGDKGNRTWKKILPKKLKEESICYQEQRSHQRKYTCTNPSCFRCITGQDGKG